MSDTEPGSVERYRESWAGIIGTMRAPGSIWHLSMEIVAMGDQLPAVRDHLAREQRDAARSLVALFMGGRDEDIPDKTLDTLGKFYVTLMTGVIAQWTFDPENAPDADELTEGLRQVIEAARQA